MMINAIHVFTQTRENYSDNPVTAPYWKCKGGRTIVLTGFSHPLNDGLFAAGQAAVDAARASIEQDNDYYKEHIIDWSFANENDLTEFEKDQLRFDGRVDSRDQRIAINQIAA